MKLAKENKTKIIMKKIYYSLILIQIGCGQKNQGTFDQKKDSKAPINVEKESNQFDNYNCNIGDPDTSLAVFLFKNCINPNFEEQKEEYIRLDLENKNITTLIKSLFNTDFELEKKIERIEENRKAFILKERELVLSDYKKFNSVDGMDFQFLYDRKDSIIKPLLKDLILNKKANSDSKIYAKELLSAY